MEAVGAVRRAHADEKFPLTQPPLFEYIHLSAIFKYKGGFAMIRKNQPLILKVGANTNLSDLKTSAFEHLQANGSVILDAIGERAAYVALRAVIFTQRQLPENVLINTRPGVVVVDTPEGERKAVRLTLELQAS